MESFSGEIQQTTKKYFSSKRKSLEWLALKGETIGGNYLRSLASEFLLSYYHLYWTT
jgi:hypothetical protein